MKEQFEYDLIDFGPLSEREMEIIKRISAKLDASKNKTCLFILCTPREESPWFRRLYEENKNALGR